MKSYKLREDFIQKVNEQKKKDDKNGGNMKALKKYNKEEII